MTLEGEVEALYPGLMAHIQGLAALDAHLSKDRPVDLHTPQGSALLAAAGFTTRVASPACH